jgi:hypothetical protein
MNILRIIKRIANSNVFKLVITLTLAKAVLIISSYFILNTQDFFEIISSQWDSKIFEDISTQGYSRDYYLVFPPVYPFLIRILSFFTGNSWLSAFILTNILSYTFPYIVYKLFGLKSSLTLELFPVYVLFTTIPYSDIIYLNFIALSFLLLNKGKTISSSLALSSSILSFYSIAWTLPSFSYSFLILRSRKELLKFMIFPLLTGVLIIAWYYLATGDPFFYFHEEANVWGVQFANPMKQYLWLLNGWFTSQAWTFLGFRISPFIWFIRNLLFQSFFLILIIYLFLDSKKSKEMTFYSLYCLSSYLPLLFVIGTPAISIPRLLLSCFPCFNEVKLRGFTLLLYIATCLLLLPIITAWQLQAFFS